MNRIILTLVICLSTLVTIANAQRTAPRPQPAAPVAAKERLTNATIIELTQLGFGEAVIIEKIRQSECQFDTTISGLKQLKAAHVTDAVIKVMVNPAAASMSFAINAPTVGAPVTNAPSNTPAASAPVATASTAPAAAAANAKLTSVLDSRGRAVPLPPDKGAYLWDGQKHTLLMQNQVSQMGANVGRAALSAMVPFAKNKLEMQLIGRTAQASFDDPQPVILLSGFGDVIPGVPAYRLLYVKQGGMRKDRRILGTYDIGGFGSVAMVDNEIPCQITKVAEGIYALKPQRPLPDGEYGLVPVTRAADMQANSKSMGMPPVWDFGVYAEGKTAQK